MAIEKQMSLVGKEDDLLSFLRERRDEIGKAVFNSIGKIEVKKRVLDVISRLQKDCWLEEDIKNYQNAIDKEHSWFDTPTFLNWYAHHFKPANFLEVGVRRGRSMSQVLVESPETKAYGFDMWIPYYGSIPEKGIYAVNPGPDFVIGELKNLGVMNLPVLTVGNSSQTLPAFWADAANPQYFELINIDGDNSYEGAKSELDIAFEHLAPGGTLVFDDINHPAHPELKGLWEEYKIKFSDYLFIEDSYVPGTAIAFRPPFDKLEKILIHNNLNKLRLLLVYSRHPKYDKVTLPEWIKESFREYFSHNVEVFACGPENEINISDSPDFYDHVSKVVNDLNIDAIWDIEGGAKSLEFMFRRFPTKISVPKIYWAVDTHQFLSLQVEKAKYFDFIFSVNKNALAAFGADAFWLPAGASVHEKDHLLKRDINIGFIGNINYGVHDRRKKILERLYREIQNFNIYSEVFFEEKTKLASRMKIMINISANNDINLRVFETLACGAMLITDKIYNNGLEYLFIEGKHLVTFETEDELIEKIKYYLNHDKERMEIARAGQDRVNAFFRHNVMLKNVIYLINQLVEKHRKNSLKQEQNNVDTLVKKHWCGEKLGESVHPLYVQSLNCKSLSEKNVVKERKSKSMKILLISLPGHLISEVPSFPLGIGYLVAMLKKEYETKAMHYQRMEHAFKQLPQILSEFNPHVVGLTCTTFNRGMVHQTIKLIKSAYPNIKIVLGGVHPSYMYEQALNTYGADVVVIGEGERTMLELCRALENGTSLDDVNGIAFKRGNDIILTPRREAIHNLDELPLPDFSYAEHLMEKSGIGYLIASRGCPVNCIFCSTGSYWGQKVRKFSVNRVVDEMELLVSKYKVKKIFFHDDTFNLGVSRVKNICNEIISRKINVEWGAQCRVVPVSQEMIDIMVEAGCRCLGWGIESGSKEMLERINKKITLEQIRNAYELCRKHHHIMSVGALTMVGNPGESEKTIEDTVNFLNTIPLTDRPSTAILCLLPGTPLYENFKGQNPSVDNYWIQTDQILYYTFEQSVETLSRWSRMVANSGQMIPFDKSKHFWNNILFGNVPEPEMPPLTSEPKQEVLCKICDSETKLFSTSKLLNKYDINYFQCSNCGFIQIEEPYGLEEAYSEAIANSDIGIIFKNTMFSSITNNILFNLFNHDAKFLDYDGGYGIFVRMMRDLGYDFYWCDKYYKNLFAKGFEADERTASGYELVTAFEVFEHLANPIEEIEKILKFSKNILFSAELLPSNNPKSGEWWYYAPQECQHISIYSGKALSIIAKKFGLNFYSNGSSLHLFTENFFSPELFKRLCHYTQQELKKTPLLKADYQKAIKKTSDTIKIVVDGIFFQINNTGIARIWKTLFEEWANDGFAKNIVVLDRAGTSPKISRVRYITVPPYDYNNTDADRVMLQKICDAEKADLFVSTYYTTPLSTPSVFMAYDMVPEMTGANLASPMWKEKHYGVYHASSYIAISENTASDLSRCFPYISQDRKTVAYCGIEKHFLPANSEKIAQFKAKYGISKPYFLIVGDRLGFNGYKNAILFFKAFSMLDNKHEFEIVCVGGTNSLEPEFVPYASDASGVKVHLLKLGDDELRCAYSGAVSLVYPSKYEGFGLPIAEAMACGCPIITCRNASIPEVAGNAVIYVNDSDVNELVNALRFIQIPQNRKLLIAAGFEQAKKFSWRKMADIVSSNLFSLSEKLSMGKISKEPLYISHLKQNITDYRQNPSEQRGVENLRQERRRIAEMLLNSPREKIEVLYQTYIGDAYNLLLTGGLQTIPPTAEDQAVIAKIIPSIQNCGIESVLTTAYKPLIERNVPLIGNEKIFISDILSVLQNGNYPPHLLQYLLAALLFFHIDIKRG